MRTPHLHGSDEPPQYPDDEDGDDWAPDDVCPKCGKPWDAASAPDEGLHPEDCHNQTHIALDEARDEIARLRAARPAVPALDAERHYHDDGCPHLPRVPWNNPKAALQEKRP